MDKQSKNSEVEPLKDKRADKQRKNSEVEPLKDKRADKQRKNRTLEKGWNPGTHD